MDNFPYMEQASDTIEARLAERLRSLRRGRGWSLEELAAASGLSRATLSRMENGETSPTARALGQLTACHGMTTSRLMALAETTHAPLVRRADQRTWTDPASGFERRLVSPPADDLACGVLEGRLPPGASIAYDGPACSGLEHHLVLLDGGLTLTVDGDAFLLAPGDCLRFRLFGPSAFQADGERGARYLLVVA